MSEHLNCEGLLRRDCLQLGLGAFLGGGLATALRARAHAGESQTPPSHQKEAHLKKGKNTSCILIWLDGGPTHYETFDPKDDAPKEIRGEFESIKTKIPGVRFSKLMKRTAAIADKLSIVRSIRHSHGNHGAGNHYMMTGAPTRIPVACGAFVSFHPSYGSVTSWKRGAPGGLPPYFSLPNMSRSGGPNFLGAKHAPFVVGGNPASKSFQVRDVSLPSNLTSDRFLGRKDLKGSLDRLRRIEEEAAGDPVQALDEYYHQGYRLMDSKPAQEAFDIHRENKKTREAYGNNSFGQRLLLSRRLVEAGVPFVTVYNGGWDHHVDIFKGLNSRLPPVDTGVAALIEDLDQRGLLDSTLVLLLGEFGRTPKINKRGGRDHWANAMSVLVAGCGTPGGQVIGATDRKGYTAVDRILSPENFASTIYTKLGIDPDQILYTPDGRPVHLVSDPNPIQELMG